MLPEALAKAAVRHRLKGVYLIPTLHNPTTLTMGKERRKELTAILRHLDLFLVEDDVYGGMEQQAQTPIATALSERSFYLTSLSKTLAPGLRLGSLTMPEGRTQAVERAMAASIWMNPPLTAEIGCRWIDDGTADRVIIAKRLAAIKRMAIVAERLAGEQLHFRPGSLNGWLQLPGPWTGESFARQAAVLGVQVVPSTSFSTGGQLAVEAVRICIGPPKNEAETTRGADILAGMLSGPAGPGRPFM